MTPEKSEWLEYNLETLYKQSADFGGNDRRYVREYIDVGEYSLALDNLAYIYARSAPKPLSAEIRQLFNWLAVEMDMRDGDEWEGVAQIRTSR